MKFAGLAALAGLAGLAGSCRPPAAVCRLEAVANNPHLRRGRDQAGRFCFVYEQNEPARPLAVAVTGPNDEPAASGPVLDDTEGAANVAAGAGVAARAGGPVTYTVGPAPAGVAFEDVCSVPGATRTLASVDDDTENIPAPGSPTIPFALRFWDEAAGPILTLSTNGWLSLRADADLGDLSGTVPSPQAPNYLIAAYWTDLVTRNGICYATVGRAPNRRFIVEWEDMREFGGGTNAHATFEIVIHEAPPARPSNVIDVIYQRLDAMARSNVSAGVENQDGSRGAVIPPPFVPRAMRFTPSS